MRKFVLLLLVLLSNSWVNTSYGQNKGMQMTAISAKLQNMRADLPAAHAIDTTRLVAYYRFHYPQDNLQGKFETEEDVLCFQIGKKVYKTFSYNLFCMDMRDKRGKHRVNYVPYTVFCNYPEGKMTQENRIPFSPLLQGSMQVVAYEEPLASWQWQLEEETDSIAGYFCRKAIGVQYGREWTVWYTQEIPVACSVWKFTGLPGLVLKAADSTGSYSFEINEIEVKQEPVMLYNWKPEYVSKEQWKRLEKDMYEHPGKYFSLNGQLKVYNQSTKQMLSAEMWTIPYNPIEKE